MALSYRTLFIQGNDPNFQSRLQGALLQDANANRILATPPLVTDLTIGAQRDRLARAIVANPSLWAGRFAGVVAVQLISKATLLDETVTTDADLFSAESAVYDKFLPAPTS